MKLRVDLTEEDFRSAIKAYVEYKFDTTITGDMSLTVETKSKQNYKSEWEQAAFRAFLEVEQ